MVNLHAKRHSMRPDLSGRISAVTIAIHERFPMPSVPRDHFARPLCVRHATFTLQLVGGATRSMTT
jgi:hypothetical protein